MRRLSSMKEKDVYVPSFLVHHGVAAWAVLPGTVGADLPLNFDLVQVARGQNLAASEPCAAIAVAGRLSFIEASARRYAAAEVAVVFLATEQRQGVEPDACELIPARRDQERGTGEVEPPGVLVRHVCHYGKKVL